MQTLTILVVCLYVVLTVATTAKPKAISARVAAVASNVTLVPGPAVTTRPTTGAAVTTKPTTVAAVTTKTTPVAAVTTRPTTGAAVTTKPTTIAAVTTTTTPVAAVTTRPTTGAAVTTATTPVAAVTTTTTPVAAVTTTTTPVAAVTTKPTPTLGATVTTKAISAVAAAENSPLACSSDGTLTYTGIPDWVLSATTTCGEATVNHTSKTIVIKNCTMGQTATVFMYSMSTTPPPKTILKENENQVNVIAISCSYTLNGEYKVIMKFPGSDTSTAFTATVKEPIVLTMSLTNVDGTSTPTKVVIGDQYSLHIDGGGNHYMKILTCTAAGNKTVTNAVTVYDANNKKGDKLGVISPLTDTSASGAGSHPLKATLTGFRLVNSLTVYLECSVKVCDTPNCTSLKRKRTKSSLKTASLKFEVVSTQSPRHANGAREINTSGKFTLTFAMVILARYITFK